MSASVAVVFAVSCVAPCGVTSRALVDLERQAVQTLTQRGFQVRPPPEGTVRPTSPEAGEQVLAELLKKVPQTDRVLVLDLERSERALWVTQYVRGVSGPWSVDKIACAKKEAKLSCAGLSRKVQAGLRPREARDVDFSASLRAHAKRVGRCVMEEDQVPIAERIFGRVEIELEVSPRGAARVVALAPSRVARSPFGACLRQVFADMNVGPFKGDPVRLRVPLDL